MQTEQELRERIAFQIARYRRQAGLTQAELAEKINYSDKSVSKWERAEGMPDIYVLSLIADACGAEIQDFFSRASEEACPGKAERKKHRLVFLLSEGTVLLSAVILWVVFSLIGLDGCEKYIWCGYPAVSAIVATVFCKLWFSEKSLAAAVSCLVWAAALAAYISVPLANIGLVFAVAAVLQAMTVLWFLMKKAARQAKD